MNEEQNQLQIPAEIFVQVLQEQIAERDNQILSLRAIVKVLDFQNQSLQTEVGELKVKVESLEVFEIEK